MASFFNMMTWSARGKLLIVSAGPDRRQTQSGIGGTVWSSIRASVAASISIVSLVTWGCVRFGPARTLLPSGLLCPGFFLRLKFLEPAHSNDFSGEEEKTVGCFRHSLRDSFVSRRVTTPRCTGGRRRDPAAAPLCESATCGGCKTGTASRFVAGSI